MLNFAGRTWARRAIRSQPDEPAHNQSRVAKPLPNHFVIFRDNEVDFLAKMGPIGSPLRTTTLALCDPGRLSPTADSNSINLFLYSRPPVTS